MLIQNTLSGKQELHIYTLSILNGVGKSYTVIGLILSFLQYLPPTSTLTFGIKHGIQKILFLVFLVFNYFNPQKKNNNNKNNDDRYLRIASSNRTAKQINNKQKATLPYSSSLTKALD